MSVGRIISVDGHVTEIERPTWESVLDAMLASDDARQHRLERDLMAWDANQGRTIHAL